MGPWSAGEGGHGVWADVKGVERRIVSVSLSALVGDVAAEADEATKAERLANANLIAAAPDGYAAAKDMLASARGVFGDNIDTYPAQWREQLRALSAFLAKAEGKS